VRGLRFLRQSQALRLTRFLIFEQYALALHEEQLCVERAIRQSEFFARGIMEAPVLHGVTYRSGAAFKLRSVFLRLIFGDHQATQFE
jgi:hypothetical protein